MSHGIVYWTSSLCFGLQAFCCLQGTDSDFVALDAYSVFPGVLDMREAGRST